MISTLTQLLAGFVLVAASFPFLQTDLPGDEGMVPLETRAEIERMQHPERYPARIYFPDLRTLPPSDLLLQILRGPGRTRLRFTNTIWNSGPGDLEVRAGPHPIPDSVWVYQIVTGEDGEDHTFDAGLFEYDPPHEHWHWQGFSVYEVWSLDGEGIPDKIVASSDKIGYCLLDMAPYPGADSPPPPRGLQWREQPQYGGCNWRLQGISAGWIDAYKTQVEGQYVDITGLPDGIYALISTVNPEGLIREENLNNNSALIYFRLEDETVTRLGSGAGMLERAAGTTGSKEECPGFIPGHLFSVEESLTYSEISIRNESVTCLSDVPTPIDSPSRITWNSRVTVPRDRSPH